MAGTGSGTCCSSRATFAKGSDAKSIAPACSASTVEPPSGEMTRKYRRSDASPVSGTIRRVGDGALLGEIPVEPVPHRAAFR